ncbi:MAG: glycine cleavage system protein H, partial [Actinomycetota bacterium]
MLIPEELRYSTDHEWARVDATRIRVGITNYAQDTLGDVVFVDLPKVGMAVDAGSA